MSVSRAPLEKTLARLNHLSEMIAGRTPLPEILQSLAETAQELHRARGGLFLYLPPERPAEFYGPPDAIPLARPLLQQLESRSSADGQITMVNLDSAGRAAVALAAPIYQDGVLHGALAVLYDSCPDNVQPTLLGLLRNQARIALEKWRLGNIDPESYDGVIQALASLIDTRDPYALRHSQAVTALAVTLADALELSGEEIAHIRYAAILHDIGKIGISEDILSKPGPLLPNERAVVEAHPLVGVSILRNIPHMEHILPLIRHHHEHYNGGGYPDQLRGDAIPLGAQIISIADVFEALTTGERSYHRGLSIPEACAILREEAGKKLNPFLVEVFLEAIGFPCPEEIPLP